MLTSYVFLEMESLINFFGDGGHRHDALTPSVKSYLHERHVELCPTKDMSES